MKSKFLIIGLLILVLLVVVVSFATSQSNISLNEPALFPEDI